MTEPETIPSQQKLIELEAFIISVQPYIQDECPYAFVINIDGRVYVDDLNHEEPKGLSKWVHDLSELATTAHSPTDVTDLTMDIQRRLTTEQGDFTTLMILSSGLKKRGGVSRG